MNDNEQIQRIRHMAEIYERGCAAVEDILTAAQRYQELKGEIGELENYYTGPQWLKDFDDDNHGKIPKDMNRGILTEDAIYDLLTDEDRMLKMLQDLVKSHRHK